MASPSRTHWPPRIVPIAPSCTLLAASHLCAGQERQSLLLGQVRRLDHGADARRVHGHGLLHEYVLACLNGRPEMRRPEVGRLRQDHEVHIGREDPLEGIPSDKAGVVRDLDLIWKGR